MVKTSLPEPDLSGRLRACLPEQQRCLRGSPRKRQHQESFERAPCSLSCKSWVPYLEYVALQVVTSFPGLKAQRLLSVGGAISPTTGTYPRYFWYAGCNAYTLHFLFRGRSRRPGQHGGRFYPRPTAFEPGHDSVFKVLYGYAFSTRTKRPYTDSSPLCHEAP